MKNFYKFEIKGYNQERFFNEVSKSYKLFDLERVDKEHSFFKVSFFNGKKVKKIIEENNFEIISIEKKGMFFEFSKILLSWGLLAGLILGFLIYSVQGLFVRKVEIWGNEKIPDIEIIDVINQNIGNRLKSNIDTKKLENVVYNGFSGLSFVSIALVGQTIIVNIKEELIPDELAGNFEPLYSMQDGIITSIDLVQGTLCVAVGDIIQKGQVLVLPYIINSSGKQMPVKAQANIFADVWIIGEEMHNSSYEEIYRTGEKVVKNEIYLCSLKIYEKKENNTFQNYEVQEVKEKLNKNNILPFILKKTTYFETKKRIVEVPFEEVKNDIIEKAKSKVLQKIEECEIIKKENIIIKEVGNIIYVSYIVMLNKNIGE